MDLVKSNLEQSEKDIFLIKTLSVRTVRSNSGACGTSLRNDHSEANDDRVVSHR